MEGRGNGLLSVLGRSGGHEREASAVRARERAIHVGLVRMRGRGVVGVHPRCLKVGEIHRNRTEDRLVAEAMREEAATGPRTSGRKMCPGRGELQP